MELVGVTAGWGVRGGVSMVMLIHFFFNDFFNLLVLSFVLMA